MASKVMGWEGGGSTLHLACEFRLHFIALLRGRKSWTWEMLERSKGSGMGGGKNRLESLDIYMTCRSEEWSYPKHVMEG